MGVFEHEWTQVVLHQGPQGNARFLGDGARIINLCAQEANTGCIHETYGKYRRPGAAHPCIVMYTGSSVKMWWETLQWKLKAGHQYKKYSIALFQNQVIEGSYRNSPDL